MRPRCFALIPAAGTGARSGADRPKQYVPLNGEAMLVHTVRAFLQACEISAVRIVFAPGDQWPISEEGRTLCEVGAGRIYYDMVGGATRAESVANGLSLLSADAHAQDWVLVHDAARPCVTPALIARLIVALANDTVGGLLGLPVADTVKHAGAGDRVTATLSRKGLWLAQTPQMFRLELLRRAYVVSPMATDEAGAVESLGHAPRLILGSPRNIKVTFESDFSLASQFLRHEGVPADPGANVCDSSPSGPLMRTGRDASAGFTVSDNRRQRRDVNY